MRAAADVVIGEREPTLEEDLAMIFYLSVKRLGVTKISDGSDNIPGTKTNLPRRWSKKSGKCSGLI
jgi:hypothetical protein